MAYVDEHGNWCDVTRGREIPDVKERCPNDEEAGSASSYGPCLFEPSVLG